MTAIGLQVQSSLMALAASLRVLLTHLIDYAGLYPPAGLPLAEVAENYERYQSSPYSWMLNRVVLPQSKLAEAPLRESWRVTLLVDDDPEMLPPEVQTLETKLPRGFSLPTYCEAPIELIEGGFAKLRTGGLTPDAIPDSLHVADFLLHAAARRLPFKATAGLHHPVRSWRALTYAADAPCAVMHGFVNVFLSAAFAWLQQDRDLLLDVLEETEPESFEFQDDGVHWRGRSIATAEIADARLNFAHSFGSCSFEEPISDLLELGLLG